MTVARAELAGLNIASSVKKNATINVRTKATLHKYIKPLGISLIKSGVAGTNSNNTKYTAKPTITPKTSAYNMITP